MVATQHHTSPETDYTKTVSSAHRKKYAQFFTPEPIADLMAKWLLGHENLQTVLEPAFGLGVFSRAILNYKTDIEITGFEIDETISEVANTYFSNIKNTNITLKDYIYNDWNEKYDGIICNPPYFKFHDYDNKNILKEIETNLKCKLNGFSNLYTLFLLKSIFQLKPNGRCAYLIPSEFLNSDYGKLVKAYLLKSETLRHIMVINFKENIFDDALTTACIILCANDGENKKVQFSNIASVHDLNKIEGIIANYPLFLTEKQVYKTDEIKPDIKWKAYYQTQNSLKFKHLVPFSNFAKVVRGIATGANEYFMFNIEKAKAFGIEEQYLLPCIAKSIDCATPFFTKTDFEHLKNNNKNIFLLNAIHSTDKKIHDYLKKGEMEGIDKKFLTASRTPWFALENRPPAPIWVSVFNRTGLRFVRNEANIANLTTFHCIYPKKTDLYHQIDIDLLFAYLLTNTAKQIFEDNCREYGNGLQKFEPNDINKAQMLNLELLTDSAKNQVLDLYKKYRTAIIQNQNANSFINEINHIFIQSYT
jgi:adenine-specific DNA-methyltransferase